MIDPELENQISEIPTISTDLTENSPGSEIGKPTRLKQHTKLVEQDQLVLVCLCVKHQQEVYTE